MESSENHLSLRERTNQKKTKLRFGKRTSKDI